jgi:hypothetical protein
MKINIPNAESFSAHSGEEWTYYPLNQTYAWQYGGGVEFEKIAINKIDYETALKEDINDFKKFTYETTFFDFGEDVMSEIRGLTLKHQTISSSIYIVYYNSKIDKKYGFLLDPDWISTYKEEGYDFKSILRDIITFSRTRNIK